MTNVDSWGEAFTYKISAGVSEFKSVYLWTNQASMPKVGMRVMISRKRQKAKNSPPSMVMSTQGQQIWVGEVLEIDDGGATTR